MKIQILICLVLALATVYGAQMPILISGNQTIQSHFETQEEAVQQISESVKQQKLNNVVVYKVETPFNLPQTLKEMRKQLIKMPTFQKIFGQENSFQSTFVNYDAQSLVEDLSRSINTSVVSYDINTQFLQQHLSNLKQEISSLEVIESPLSSLKQLEKIIQSEFQAASSLIVVLFSEKQGNTLRLLEEEEEEVEQQAENVQAPTPKHAVNDNAKSGVHYLSDIRPSTLWALIVVLLIIFTLYCGVGALSGIQSPISFEPHSFHVGKES